MNLQEQILRNQLEAYLAERPEAGTDSRIETLTRIGGRGATDVYAFTLVYDEASERVTQKLVLKTYANSPEGIDRALKERHALFHLRTARYPVPSVVAIETSPEALGVPFVIMQQVEGQTLGAALVGADDRKQRGLVAQFVGLLVDLHARGPEALIRREMSPVSAHALINREVHILRGLAQNRDQQEYLPVIEWLYERRKSVSSGAMVINHRNYTLSNVLVGPTGAMSVVDWGWQIGDARFDLAWTLLDLERAGLDELRDAVLAEYERVTGAPVEDLPYFEVLAATRWLMDVLHKGRAAGDFETGVESVKNSMVGPVSHTVTLITARTGIELPDARTLLA